MSATRSTRPSRHARRSPRLASYLRLSCCAALPNLAVFDQDGALRAPRAGTSVGLRPWGGPGRRVPTLTLRAPLIKSGSHGRHPLVHGTTFLGGPVSRSRVPRRGRPTGVACDRLRRTSTRHPLAGFGAYQEGRGRPGIAKRALGSCSSGRRPRTNPVQPIPGPCQMAYQAAWMVGNAIGRPGPTAAMSRSWLTLPSWKMSSASW